MFVEWEVFAPCVLTREHAARREQGVNKLYSFETWARQSLDFLDAFVGEPAFIICNSVGGGMLHAFAVCLAGSLYGGHIACPLHTAGIAGLQAAVDAPCKVRGVQLLDVSLRMLHVTKQAPWQRPLVASFQRLLRTTQLGAWFFGAIAKPRNIRSILRECYVRQEAVTEELVDYILRPGLEVCLLDLPCVQALPTVLTVANSRSRAPWRCFWTSSATRAGRCRRSCCRAWPAPSASCGARPTPGSPSPRGAPTPTLTAWRSLCPCQVCGGTSTVYLLARCWHCIMSTCCTMQVSATAPWTRHRSL